MDGVTALVGTSGWQYRHWRERFYPKGLAQAEWLPYYAASFTTVEVNNSFYRLPRRELVERWASVVPEDFVLTFKANRYLTHIRRLRDCAEPLERFRDVVAGAGRKLGPVLFQLPPSITSDVPLLRSFLAALPAGLRAAFEFRHPSWFTAETFGALDASGSAVVHADRPGTRVEALPIVGGWTYLRFHQGRRSLPAYPRRKLRDYADRVAEIGQGEVFAYFNNDPNGAAVRDAATFIELLEERQVAVPRAPRAA